MIIGIISDTHDDGANALPYVIKELIKRGAKHIIHCGDIEPQHVKPELFANLPVTCALNKEQLDKIDVKNPPPGWEFTIRTGEDHASRIIDINHLRLYVGHKFSFRLLVNPQEAFIREIDKLRKDHDGLREVCAGHTHHQVFVQSETANFINPGAICASINNSHEFATLDTTTNDVTFSRIIRTKPADKKTAIGVISDSLNISRIDPDFWKSLKEELKRRDVGTVIHCGNIATEDIGHPEMGEFEVYYFSDCNKKPPQNWSPINEKKPIIEVAGRQFYLHLRMARILLGETESDMHRECLKILEEHPCVEFVLYGGTNNAFLAEGQRAYIINPGDVRSSRNFAVITLPITEIFFGHVPLEPFPPIN